MRRERNEYAHTVVLCRSFWLQSTKTLPGRFAFVMSTSTRSGSRDSISCPSASANRLVSSSVDGEPTSGTERCRPLPPDVFTTQPSPSCSRVSRSSSATRQQSTIVAGAPGSRSMHECGRVVGIGDRPLVRVQLERGEVGEPDERGHARRRCSPWCRPSPRSPAKPSTQAGWWPGQFFSKNRFRPGRRAPARAWAAARPGGAASPGRCGGSSR